MASLRMLSYSPLYVMPDAVLCIHGTLDDIAPIALGRELYEALPATRKRFVELEEAGHNDIPYNDPSRYLREASAFLRGI